MFDLLGKTFRNCDGITRREALRVGGLAAGAFGLADLLRLRADADESKRDSADTAIIQIFMGGGPSHIDTYDMKPGTPAEIRGEFRSIATSVPGTRICEHLPLQSAIMDKVSVVRSGTHTQSSHLPASHWMQTGYPLAGQTIRNEYPSCGSVVSRLRGPNQPGMPAYAAVPRQLFLGGAAYLGAAYNPFTTEVEPNSPTFQVRSLKLQEGVSFERVQGRQSLLQQFDGMRRDLDLHGNLQGLDEFSRKAVELVTSDRAARAFNLDAEDPKLRDRYGRHSTGQNCILARRLVEAGVTFVTCMSGGEWDTHQNNFSQLKQLSLPRIDQALSALVTDLHERGLDRKVLVMAFGEFGRTPKINPGAGRDHWPGAMSVLYAGGGLKMGQMIGETNSIGAYPISKPASPGCLFATMYHVLGIDPRHEFQSAAGRPIPILSEGRAIADLI